MTWDIRFADIEGKEPARDWLEELTGKDLPKQLAAIAAIERVLATQGTDVCKGEWGKNFGKGLYEFRIRHDAETIARMFPKPGEAVVTETARAEARILLRIFFTTSGRQIILLVSAYDKGRDPSARRQQAEIERARKLIAKLRLTKG